MSDCCPSCGRPLPKVRTTLTPEERIAKRRAQIAAKMTERAERDRRMLFPLLDETFRLPDVGYAMRAHGRHWSEAQAAIQRWARLGWITRERVDLPRDKRVFYQWRKVNAPVVR